jgi:electron transfer flavoprotein alpha subunit
MGNILVVTEQFKGKLRKASLNAIGAGQALKARVGGDLHILAIGKGIQNLGPELAGYGAAGVHVADVDALANPIAELYGKVIADAAKAAGATWIIAAATNAGKDILPRTAARLGAGLASDVMGFVGDGPQVQFKRAMWGGTILATVDITTPIKVITVRPTEFPEATASGATSPVSAFTTDLGTPKTRYLKFQEVKSERPELTEAAIVVSGGRGTKGDFAPIEALADALGAAVGASRAVVDAGWQPNDLQVGQTGKVVAPKLYVAIGISGAIQHLAGMKGSKTIVAINKDPEAPIFQVADYGLVADLFKAAPELTAEVRKIKAQ